MAELLKNIEEKEEFFYLSGECVRTYVTKRHEKIDVVLKSFLHPSYSGEMKVIGLDVEWHMSKEDTMNEVVPITKCATLNLCNGYSCIIIQLLHFESIPASLLNFLRMPDYIFVGVGIKDNLDKLEKQCGIRCKNAVELAPLAATVMKRPRLRDCGVEELAFAVADLKLRKFRPPDEIFEDWGKSFISSNQAKLAAINTFSYYKIGIRLLAESDDYRY
ncbi:uncharacterized protein LOC109807126 [Cajanus cajan]|uniref:3'-5' exonuclease domain-containing protein n=1 Tax=Cajanus cajan TaxID=3821 RepID=A0A151SN21_CAJCA|nr:uncharacterized protein LOC109807126 [Cajanus cajan]KYP56158.1 hypothetical protein KK1_002395 [Cajanus cajan]